MIIIIINNNHNNYYSNNNNNNNNNSNSNNDIDFGGLGTWTLLDIKGFKFLKIGEKLKLLHIKLHSLKYSPNIRDWNSDAKISNF